MSGNLNAEQVREKTVIKTFLIIIVMVVTKKLSAV